MFVYILRAQQPPGEQLNEFFRRFKETPGLVHAYNLQEEENPNEGAVVAIWESREAAQRYIEGSPLKREVDQATPGVTRTFYKLLDSK